MSTNKKPVTLRTLWVVWLSSSLLLAAGTNAFADTPVADLDTEATRLTTRLPSDIRQLESHLTGLPDCNSPSGSRLALGDTYYDFAAPASADINEVAPTTDIEHFRHLVTALNGHWIGAAYEKVCFVSSRERIYRYEIDALDFSNTASKRRYPTDHHSLAIVKVDRTRVASSEENLSTGEVRNVLLFTLPPIREMQNIEKMGEQSFRIRSLFREKAVSTGGSILREREDWLQKNGNKLAWRTDWHTNGHYSGSEYYVLERR